jgi:hypothetical protein
MPAKAIKSWSFQSAARQWQPCQRLRPETVPPLPGCSHLRAAPAPPPFAAAAGAWCAPRAPALYCTWIGDSFSSSPALRDLVQRDKDSSVIPFFLADSMRINHYCCILHLE